MNKNLRRWTDNLLGLAAWSLLSLVAGCVVHVHDHGYGEVDVVDTYGYHHHGYYDDDHHWHGGYYDHDNVYHDDPGDWHH